MKKRITHLSFMFLLLSGLAHAKDVTLSVPYGTDVKLSLPTGWEQEALSPTNKKVAATRLYADADKTVSMQFILFANPTPKDTAPETQEKLDQQVKALAQKQYLPQAVEKKVSVQKLNSKNLLGAYAQFTSKSYDLEKDPTKRKYKYVTTVSWVLEKTVATVTILSTSLTDKKYQEALSLLSQRITKK